MSPSKTLAIALIAVGCLSTSATAQKNGARYTAFAVNLGGSPGATSAMVEIHVERWSTPAELDKFFEVLAEQGPDKVLALLQGLPRIGSMSTTGSVGFPLRLARKTLEPDGHTRVVLLTDRPTQFVEQWNQSRSLQYPFTMAELLLTPAGTGEGKLNVATKIGYHKDTKTLMLERYSDQPVLLNNVKTVN